MVYSCEFYESGLNGFSDTEVIEFLLSFRPSCGDAGKTSRQLIDNFDSLREVVDAVATGRAQSGGMSEEQVLLIRLVKDISERYLNQNLVECPLGNSPKAIFDYLYHSMRGLDKEVFKVISLNGSNRIIDIHDAAIGTVSEAVVYIREIIKHLILLHANSAVFVHNHLDNNVNPSKDDRQLTDELMKACKLMNIRVLDHIIIGDNKYYSFADAGIIKAEKII